MRKWALVVVALALCLAPEVMAQRTTAGIRGTVTDDTGGVLPGASVTMSNQQTGLTRTVFTNEAGVYSFGNLQVGTYDLEVSLSGFKTSRISGIELNVADTREANVKLELGEISEQVTVQASSVLVETIGGEVSGLIDGEQIRELPLNGRNFTQLTLLMPGVSAPDTFDTKNKGLLTGTDLSVSGGSVTGNLWTVDGANNNDVGSNRTILVYPSVDAIEEFKIHRNSYGAEFGGAGGAQINLITRSGTNELHGSLFYFTRDDSLNEANFFLERAGLDTEALNRDDYGYTLGGAIIQDRLHFFASQEWNEEVRGVVRSGFVPTLAERSGDFSGPQIPGCTLAAPIDPLTGQPFPGNVIPADRLSDAGLQFLNLYPLPNNNPVDGSCNNWLAAVDTPIDWEQANARLDYTVTDSARVMVRYTRDDWINDAPNAGEANGLWGDDPFPVVDSAWDQKGESLVLQLNQTLGSSAVNTLQYSFSGNSIEIRRGGTNPGLNASINDAIPSIFSDKQGGAERSHPVFWGSQGYAPLWNIAPWENEQDLQILKDDYQQVFGRHTLKAGFTYSDNEKQEFINGASAFETPQFWGAGGINGWGATTGNILADFLLEDMTFGFSENSFQPNAPLEWQEWEVYLSDSWQLRDNLTVDYGVRYSRFEDPYASNDNIASFVPELFDPALGSDPCNGLILPPGNTACQDAGFAGGQEGPNRALVEEDTNNFAPRLGLAWDVFGDGRTAIRAGFGQFFQRERVNIQLDFAGSPPFIRQRNGIRKLDDATEPCEGCFGLANGVPTRGIDLDAEDPYNMQWNLTWEQQIGARSTFELSYVGSRGVHLSRRSDINQVPSGDPNGNGIPDRLEYVRAVNDPAVLGSLRPYSAFGDALILYWENDGESEYHSLQTQYRARLPRGSQFQISYTWSDLEANDPLTDSGAGTFDGQIIDRDNPDLDYGKAGIHREHVANASLLLNLPTFENKGRWFRTFFGDWAIGAIGYYSSGVPLNVTIGGVPGLNGPAGTGFADNQRPNRVPGEPCRSSGGPAEQWLNPNAYTLAGYQLGTNGNARRGDCEGPDYLQFDLSFYKNLRVTERFKVQLRFEVFNVFNRDNFVAVDTTLDPTSVTLDAPLAEATEITDFTLPASFGQAARVRDPRQIQLGIKLLF